ncbi:hypothetical protein GHU64_06735 [Pseudomonas aeruginosa]|nr:hypothetical protein [Pseudomonas aeruginosa]
MLKSIIQTQAKQKEQEKGIGYKIAKQVITILGTSILLTILAFNADIYLNDMITRYINDDPISQNPNYKLCMAEKNDVPNCTQYVEVIGRHSHTLDIAETRQQKIDVMNKVRILQLATTTFNTKIYNDIETCSARNLPDTRSMTGRILGEPTLLFRCQSAEIMEIKGQSLILDYDSTSPMKKEKVTPETKTETKTVSHQEAAINFLVILLAFALLFITMLGNENKKKKK